MAVVLRIEVATLSGLFGSNAKSEANLSVQIRNIEVEGWLGIATQGGCMSLL